MRRWRYQTGRDENKEVMIPGGQIVAIGIVPHATLGSYIAIGNQRGIYVPAGTTFGLDSEGFGALIELDTGTNLCDYYPGDQTLVVSFGTGARPANASPDADGTPQSWFVAWIGQS